MEGKKFVFHALIEKEPDEEFYSSICLENNVASQGRTHQEAFKNLKEAVALYVESVLEDKDYANLFRPASKEDWDRFFAEKNIKNAKKLELIA